MSRLAARHDGVRGDLAQRRLAQPRLDDGDKLVGIPTVKDRLAARGRRREHRQAIGPTATVEDAVEGLDGVGTTYASGRLRSVELTFEQ